MAGAWQESRRTETRDYHVRACRNVVAQRKETSEMPGSKKGADLMAQARKDRDAETERLEKERTARAERGRKKKKDSEEEESEESEESEEEERDPKLEKPKKDFKGEEEREKYKSWRRGITIWRNQYSKQSELKLGAKLMECLTGDAEELVYAKVVEGSETFTEVIGVLDRAFGDKGLPESLAALNEYNDFTRGKLTLMTFLTKHTTLRAKAVKYGLAVSERTDGALLLQKAQLTSTQHTGIVQTLRVEAKLAGTVFVTPEYTPTFEALEMLAQSLMTMDDQQGRQKRKMAFIGAEDTPKRFKTDKGKDKGGKDKGTGKGKGLCWEYAQKGSCQFGAACRYSHGGAGKPGGKDKGKDKGGGKGAQVRPACRQYAQKGACAYGKGCWFHHVAGGKGKDTGGKGPEAGGKGKDPA